MVKFKLHFAPKITVETIDDAEGTPGASRQYTRFNSIVKPKIERVMNECAWKKSEADVNSRAVDAIRDILRESEFVVAHAEATSSDLDVLVTIDSIEK